MLSEMEHLPKEAPRFRWALGCVLVSYMERARAMNRASFTPISPWVLTLEMAVCFAPLTLLFVGVIVSVAHGAMTWRNGLLYSSGTLLGPVGLGVALGKLFLVRGPMRSMTATALAVLVAWTLFAYCGLILHNGTPPGSWWREFVLIAILPTLASVHLTLLRSQKG